MLFLSEDLNLMYVHLTRTQLIHFTVYKYVVCTRPGLVGNFTFCNEKLFQFPKVDALAYLQSNWHAKIKETLCKQW